MVQISKMFACVGDGEFAIYRFEQGGKQGLARLSRREAEAWRGEAEDGCILAPAIWDEIRLKLHVRFEPEFALDCCFFVRSGDLWGMLNQAGEALEPPRFDWIDEGDLDDAWDCDKFEAELAADDDAALRAALRRISGDVRVMEGDFHGIVSSSGALVVPPAYDSVVRCTNLYDCFSAPTGYIVQRGWLYGAHSPEGKLVVPPEYDMVVYVDCTEAGPGAYEVVRDERVGLIDAADGRVILDAEWDSIERILLFHLSDGAVRGCHYKFRRRQSYGLSDGERVLIPPVWDEIREQRRRWCDDPHGYAVRRGQLWGLCDERGELVSEPQWSEAELSERFPALPSVEPPAAPIAPEAHIEALDFLGARAFNHLLRAGLDTVSKLLNCPQEALQEILGEAAAADVRAGLQALQLSSAARGGAPEA